MGETGDNSSELSKSETDTKREFEYEVREDHQSSRLDQFLSEMLGDNYSRAMIQKWIQSGHVEELNSGTKLVKPSSKVNQGYRISLKIPSPPKFTLEPLEMPITVILDKKDYMVIDKPPGIASHGGPGDTEPSLVNALIHHFSELSSAGGENRPGIVHRLDKATSGLMIIAKNDSAHYKLAKMFHDRQVKKRYVAWLLGAPSEPEGTIDKPIRRHPKERMKMTVSSGGRKAITHYKVIKTVQSRKRRKFSLVEIDLETGRTHQIRVHFHALGCPVVGDPLYSRNPDEFSNYGLLLFSQSISFTDPFSGENIQLSLPYPERFIKFEKLAENY